jgi:hypothetical protein
VFKYEFRMPTAKSSLLDNYKNQLGNRVREGKRGAATPFI